MDIPIDMVTPLLRVGGAWAKLESMRPSGGVEDRLLGLWDEAPAEAMACGAQGAALAAAAWARARGVKLQQIVWGPLTHEAKKTLEIWGQPFVHLADRTQALRRAHSESTFSSLTLLPPLDGNAAVLHGAGLARELAGQLVERPAALVAPVGSRAALLACAKGFPGVRLIAVAGPAELPDLGAPFIDEAESIEVTRAFAAEARRRLSRVHGLLASHASAAAVAVAEQLGGGSVALVTAAGEREFSLDPREPS